jgi:hypothetical protein
MLNWSDEAGFENFGDAFEDPSSPAYRKTISAEELTARFGPSQAAYDAALDFLQKNGFTLVEGSANRLTLTVRGTRAQAERTFGVRIDDYQLGTRQFHASDSDPALPETLAPLIRSVSGFSNLAHPRTANGPSPATPMSIATAYNGGLTSLPSFAASSELPPGIDGAGQTIGLIEFANYDSNDVVNWLRQVGLPQSMVNQVSTFPVNGGTPLVGCGNPFVPPCDPTEVLLDIDAVLGMAPGANIVVFVAPQGTSMINVINSAINRLRALTSGGGGILSLSFSLSEDGRDGVSSSDADSMEGLLQSATYSGFSLFVASGDNGSTSVDGKGNMYPNRVTFPADAPHAVAVGGTMLQVGANNSYQSESWWTNGNDGTFGNGGFGFSWHFPRPGYQNRFTNASGRSVPDVSAAGGSGIVICEGAANGRPNCQNVNGTSLSAPLWAGIWALASQAAIDARGPFPPTAGGGYFYGLNGNAFHSPSTMTGPGNDFSHVGLGSPNITNLVADVAGPPAVTSIYPVSGPVTGGTGVTITGKALIGVSKVLFGGVPASSFTVLSDTQINATSPPRSAYTSGSDVTVITPAGTSLPTGADVFGYSPIVTGVSPNFGSINGGSTVTVTGAGFNTFPASAFYFGSAPAKNVSCSSATTCVMASPAHAAGTVDVTAELFSHPGLPSSGDHFTYEGPGIYDISPTIGPTYGGTRVDLYGVSLSSSMTVKFGSTPAEQRSVFCYSDAWCTVNSPTYWSPYPSLCSVCASVPVPLAPNGVATVPITVTVGNLTSRPLHEFTYAIYPAIFSVSPSSGAPASGTPVTVTGNYFSTTPGGTSFLFGSSPATNVTCTPIFCTMTSPPWNGDVNSITVAVIATVDGKMSQSPMNGLFTYNVPSPPSRPPCQGSGCCIDPKHPNTCQ